MAEREYTEPTNEQLANFLVVEAKSDPRLTALNLSPPILESLMSQRPDFRAAALQRHRRFQDQIHELTEKMNAGELRCEEVLRSGKQCPNRNEPGRMYCGLHGHDEDDQDSPRSLE